MTASRYPGSRVPASDSIFRLSHRTNVCSHTVRTARSAGLREQRGLAGERLARRRGDLDRHDLAGPCEALEVHDLVMRRPATEPRWVLARMAFDEDVQRPADE